MSSSMKKVALVLTVVTVISFGIAGVINRFSGDFDYNKICGAESQDVDAQKVYAASNIKHISVKTVSTDINIVSVDEPDIRVHLHGSATNPPELVVTGEETDSLNIELRYPRQSSPIFSVNTGFSRLQLEVYVPTGFAGDLRVGTTSGDTEVSKLSLGSFRFGSVSGDLRASSLNTRESVVETTSGNVNLTGFKGDLNFGSVSGDLTAEYDEFANAVMIETTSGDTELRLPKGSAFGISFRSTSGDFNTSFPVTVQGLSREHDFEGVVGSNTNKITARTVSGDLKIDRR